MLSIMYEIQRIGGKVFGIIIPAVILIISIILTLALYRYFSKQSKQ